MVKSSKKPSKPKTRSKMSRENKKKTTNVAKSSKQEKKFHRKVKNNVALKKNTNIYQKNKPEPKKKFAAVPQDVHMNGDDDVEDEELILPLDMLSDDEWQPMNMRLHSDDEDEDERMESYERQPRTSFEKLNKERALLPIKTDRGQLVSQSMVIKEPVVVDEDETVEPSEPKTVAAPSAPTKPVSVVELMAERENKLNESKQSIVHLCDLIMKSPYDEISNLKRLRLLLNLGDPLISMTVRKLTMISLVELFRDIVPGYRIRSLKETAKDDDDELKSKKPTKKETLSKDVKVIRHFEQTLLKHYQHFLHFLEQCAKKNLPDNHLTKTKHKESKTIPPSKLTLGHLAIQCLCKLLTALHHFNFRTNLLSVIVQFMVSR